MRTAHHPLGECAAEHLHFADTTAAATATGRNAFFAQRLHAFEQSQGVGAAVAAALVFKGHGVNGHGIKSCVEAWSTSRRTSVDEAAQFLRIVVARCPDRVLDPLMAVTALVLGTLPPSEQHLDRNEQAEKLHHWVDFAIFRLRQLDYSFALSLSDTQRL